MRKPPHRPMWKIAWVLGFVAAGTLLTAVSAFADDCTDWGNCAMAPDNIDAATGLAALLPPLTLLYLYLNRRNGGPAVAAPLLPVVPASIDDLRDEFDALQEQLRDQALDQLKKMREAHLAYTDKWKEAMEALEDYLMEYQHLLPGLKQIWEQMGSREDARRIAEAADMAVMLTSMGVGLIRGAANTAAREVLQTARRAGRGVEIEAARRAAREALAKDVRALQAAERAAAQRAAREAERATARRQSDEALDRAMDDKIADLTARRAKAEKELLDLIRPINPTGHRSNCVWATDAVDNAFAGRGTFPAKAAGPPAEASGFFELKHGKPYTPMGNGTQGKAALDKLLAQNPGSRGVVIVEWKNSTSRHAFYAVNKDGFVFYPDGQIGKMMPKWDQVDAIKFLRTN